MTAEDLNALRTIEIADVLKAGHLSATLQRTSAGVAFAYIDDYLRAGGPAVATSLPLSAEVRNCAADQDAILKLTPPEYPHLVDNEAWFLGLARRAGFTVPAYQVVADGAGERGLLVARFDRQIVDGRIVS